MLNPFTSELSRAPLRVLSAAAVLCSVVTTVVLLSAPPAGAAILPPASPADFQPSAAMSISCAPPVNARACDTAALGSIDSARAAEGVGPMVLPTNYYSLTAPEQLLVVVDLERVDRGLAPVAGLTAALDQDALVGATGGWDPPLPPGAPAAASLWFGGWATPLFDDFFWMYDDGPGGVNVTCCWDHRDEILAAWPGSPTEVEMGAAVVGTAFYPASAAVVVAAGQAQTPVFSWAAERPYLTFATAPGQVDLGAVPDQTVRSSVAIEASGVGGSFAAVVSGGGGQWSVYPASCAAGPGQSCRLTVSFRPLGTGPVPATLDISGPTGSRSVALQGGPWNGYWLAAADGGVFSYGTAQFFGSAGGYRLARPVVGAAATADHDGYWLVASDGGVFSYGDAGFHGSAGNLALARPVVGMAVDHPTGGYWLVASDGGVFSYGAPFAGSAGRLRLSAPIVGMAATPTGRGYWLVGADGGVFSYGDARFMGAITDRASAPITAIAASPTGQGYWLTAADGSVYAFGDAPFQGGMFGHPTGAPVDGIAAAPGGHGYWLSASNGAVFSFAAPFHGSAGVTPLRAPVVGIAAG